MEIRPLRPDEMERAWELDAEAFHGPPDQREVFLRFVDPVRLIGAFEGDRLGAMAGAIGFGQFFGGRSVPMGGLSSVAVAPDWRGSGIAKRVCTACIEAMHARGEVISSLFPATTSLYRSLGWELGGHFTIRKTTPAQLRGLPRPGAGAVRPFAAGDLPALRASYTSVARPANGCLDRPQHWWDRLAFKWQQRTAFVFEGASGEIEGHLVYRQMDGEFSHLGGDWGIVVDEIVCATRDAALGLWGLLASWSSQVESLIFRGGAEDPTLLVLPEQAFQTLGEIRWMIRVVDAPGAIAARGFPKGLDLEVPLRLHDPIVAANDGDWVLTVQKGRGALERASDATGPALGINAFSSLYSGWSPTAGLARAALIEGGTSDQRAALDAAFTGPTPWLFDEF